MHRYLASRRKKIDSVIQLFLGKEKRKFATVNQWGPDVFERLEHFLRGGKMLRGIMVVFAYEACGGKNVSAAYQLGAVMELLHATLLIHDDIMDRDDIRRGSPSIHAQYREYAEKNRTTEPDHFGYSMAINIGDILFFLAMRLFGKITRHHKNEASMHDLVTGELVSVGLAQMEDMSLASEPQIPDKSRIISMYHYKTARYSFSLPLLLGALLAHGPATVQKKFETLGETLGILYQIKDDELGLFGNEKELGKTIGIDIREGKKTLPLLSLFEVCSLHDRKRLVEILGYRQTDEQIIRWTINLLKEHTIQEELQERQREFGNHANRQIGRLPINNQYRAILQDFVTYNLERTR